METHIDKIHGKWIRKQVTSNLYTFFSILLLLIKTCTYVFNNIIPGNTGCSHLTDRG